MQFSGLTVKTLSEVSIFISSKELVFINRGQIKLQGEIDPLQPITFLKSSFTIWFWSPNFSADLKEFHLQKILRAEQS